MKTILFVLVALAAVAFVFLKLKLQGGAGTASDYRPKRLLTANELEFLGRLEAAVPEMRFHAQVAMGAIVEPNANRREDGKNFMRLRGSVAQKIVDFVAQDRATGDIVALIELDDRTHNAAKDAARDALTASAGYATLRWHSKNKPDAQEIRAKLLAAGKRVEGQPATPNR